MSLQTNGTVLLVSPEPWEGHFVSKHHYAVTLAGRGFHVYFLNPPDVSAPSVQIRKTDYENVWSVSAPLVAKGLRFYPAWLRRRVEARWLRKLEQQIGEEFSAVWLFENSRFYDMHFAGQRTKIYHQVDLNQDFHVKQAAKTADVCFANTDAIMKRLAPYNAKVYKSRHGVAMPTTKPMLTEEQNGRFVKDAVNAVYIGNLDIGYLNNDLLAELVQRFQNVRFHFVGRYSEKGTLYLRCGGNTNVSWWGAVPSALIPVILSYCDIQLLTYRVETAWEKEQMASPHKVMEYLASGKVIVATYTDEYKEGHGLLEMVAESEDYLRKFDEVTSNLDHYNGITRQQERIAFAQDNTYPKQLERIITVLNKHHLKL